MSKIPANYYFNETEVLADLAVWMKFYEKQEEYKQLIDQEIDLESNVDKLKAAIRDAAPYLERIMDAALKVARGVIFRAGFHKQEKYDILMETATVAMLSCLPRFDVSKGTLFNYLSLTAKKSCIFYLIRRSQGRTFSLDATTEDDLKGLDLIRYEEKSVGLLEIESLCAAIEHKIKKTVQKPKALPFCLTVFKSYLVQSEGKFDKREFYEFGRMKGLNMNKMRGFMRYVKSQRKDLSTEVGVY